MRRSILILTALASALLLAACGGSETTTSSSSSDTAAAPQATNSVDDVAAQLEAASSAGDCAAYLKLYLDPGVLDCSQKDIETTLATTKISGQAQYGTGGVIDVTDAVNDGPVSFILAVDASGRFSIEDAYPVDGTSVGSVADRAKFDTAASNVVTALREKDCDTFFANALTGPRSAKQSTCKSAFSNQNPTIALLSSDESAKPEYLGGNANVAFYSLTFNGGDYLTMPVLRLPLSHATREGDAKYLGLVPVPAT